MARIGDDMTGKCVSLPRWKNKSVSRLGGFHERKVRACEDYAM